MGAAAVRHRRLMGLSGLLLGTALLLHGGCTGRERSNPFDPLNPDSGGEPSAARAQAGCQRVELSWSDLGMEDLRGFRVWRAELARDAEPGSLITAEMLPPEARGYLDQTARNATVYTYRLEFCFRGDTSHTFASPVSARAGAALPWVSDPCGWGLSRLAPDAGGVLATEAYGSAILDLDVDATAHRIFAAQIDSGQVLVYRSTGERLAALPVAGASCVSWSPTVGALAVGAFYEGRLSWLTPEGELLGELELGNGPEKSANPEDVAFRDSSTTWIALNEGLLLRAALSSGLAETLAVDLDRPVAVVDDPGRGCWVADRGGGLLYVRDDGTFIAAAEGLVDEPLDLDRGDAGDCWVADWGGEVLLRVDRDLQVIEQRTDLGPVAGVTYDPASDALWNALPERGEVLFLSLADGWQRRILVGGCPRKVAGDWTGGCGSD